MGPDLEHPDDLAWAAYADGALGDIARARLGLHLDRCPECATLVARLLEANALEQLGDVPAVSPMCRHPLGRMVPPVVTGAPAWSARFSVRPKGPATTCDPRSPENSLRPSQGPPMAF